MKGKIIKGIAGFYYVHVEAMGIYECKAKGIFRKQNIKPLPGDDVCIDLIDEAEKKGNINRVRQRKNVLIRPAVANIDQALVVFSVFDPKPSLNLLDRFLLMMEYHQIPVAVCFNKGDLADKEKIETLIAIYSRCGYEVYQISVKENMGLSLLRKVLLCKTTVLAGPSGVGKSSLINALQSDITMETGKVSKKKGCGRHTTRHTQLIPVDNGTYVMDTPGFSSMYLDRMAKEDLKNYFREFAEYEPACRFQGCTHRNEPNCGVKTALEQGQISRSRYDNYCLLFEELKEMNKY